ncbi:hypothetical protein EIP86_006394 [Pleurotus ostreatoroseus]|nr:hypothetical protein EIP86_006394 [Pleurotus ostreatoroseus]
MSGPAPESSSLSSTSSSGAPDALRINPPSSPQLPRPRLFIRLPAMVRTSSTIAPEGHQEGDERGRGRGRGMGRGRGRGMSRGRGRGMSRGRGRGRGRGRADETSAPTVPDASSSQRGRLRARGVSGRDHRGPGRPVSEHPYGPSGVRVAHVGDIDPNTGRRRDVSPSNVSLQIQATWHAEQGETLLWFYRKVADMCEGCRKKGNAQACVGVKSSKCKRCEKDHQTCHDPAYKRVRNEAHLNYEPTYSDSDAHVDLHSPSLSLGAHPLSDSEHEPESEFERPSKRQKKVKFTSQSPQQRHSPIEDPVPSRPILADAPILEDERLSREISPEIQTPQQRQSPGEDRVPSPRMIVDTYIPDQERLREISPEIPTQDELDQLRISTHGLAPHDGILVHSTIPSSRELSPDSPTHSPAPSPIEGSAHSASPQPDIDTAIELLTKSPVQDEHPPPDEPYDELEISLSQVHLEQEQGIVESPFLETLGRLNDPGTDRSLPSPLPHLPTPGAPMSDLPTPENSASNNLNNVSRETPMLHSPALNAQVLREQQFGLDFLMGDDQIDQLTEQPGTLPTFEYPLYRNISIQAWRDELIFTQGRMRILQRHMDWLTDLITSVRGPDWDRQA